MLGSGGFLTSVSLATLAHCLGSFGYVAEIVNHIEPSVHAMSLECCRRGKKSEIELCWPIVEMCVFDTI